MEFELYFKVNGLSMAAKGKYAIPAMNRNYVRAYFDFSNEWIGHLSDLIGIFIRGDTTIRAPVESWAPTTATCIIPSEILAEPGLVRLSLVSDNRAVTEAARFYVVESAFDEDAPSPDPSPEYDYVQTPSANRVKLIQAVDEEFQFFANGVWHTVNLTPGNLMW